MTYDATDPANPYPDNPAVLAKYENLVAFKNGTMDVVNSMLIYLTTQEMANAYYAEHTN